MKINQLKNLIKTGELDSALANNCALVPDKIREDYLKLCDSFSARFGEERDVYLLSVGGRTEVSGNHTDHNKGKVMAAAVSNSVMQNVPPQYKDIMRAVILKQMLMTQI